MGFNKTKCKVLHLSWGNPSYWHRLGEMLFENNTVGKDLEFWWMKCGTSLAVSQHCVLVAERANGIIEHIYFSYIGSSLVAGIFQPSKENLRSLSHILQSICKICFKNLYAFHNPIKCVKLMNTAYKYICLYIHIYFFL